MRRTLSTVYYMTTSVDPDVFLMRIGALLRLAIYITFVDQERNFSPEQLRTPLLDDGELHGVGGAY
jgi:hypothetical protein